jgi:NAD(P)-dependent dehydrogenase (short-subunit alcohol dehydrogenase family)
MVDQPTMNVESTSRIALITGAGSGIGRATAIALSDAGFIVVLAGRKRETLEVTARSLKSSNPAHSVWVADVTRPADVERLFDHIRDTYGRLDLLFNNAGISAPRVPLEDVPYDTWRSVIDTTLTGAFLCTQQAIKMMKAQEPRGGRIINNGSVSAQVPRPHSAPYTAAKHAMTGLTKSTALDGRAFNIACGQIDIGNADTAMGGAMKQGVPQANGDIAIEPTFAVHHVANAILYMAGLPLDANVPFITVMATQMPLVGRG